MTTILMLKKAGMGNTAATLLGTVTTMGIGLIKEASDPVFDKNDIVSNGIGCASSLALNLVFDF